ncbi:hypothetical protein LXA47_32545 [Massilia sp. P8910]|uniref:hypothetical protein n=1 Tax=Massilia antarctica TaxID=2765360 RepID=UPI001E4120C2|nr:hypothetical protein [Massilia antarctica]MCE3608299.1 hypothetical protein [Massilia antarctica]
MKKASATNGALALICLVPGGGPRPIWTVARREHEYAACPWAGTTAGESPGASCSPDGETTRSRPLESARIKSPFRKSQFFRLSNWSEFYGFVRKFRHAYFAQNCLRNGYGGAKVDCRTS